MDTDTQEVLRRSGLKGSLRPLLGPGREFEQKNQDFFVLFLFKVSDLYLPLQALSLRVCVHVCAHARVCMCVHVCVCARVCM